MKVYTFFPGKGSYTLPMFSMLIEDGQQEPDEKEYDREFQDYCYRQRGSTIVRQPRYFTIQDAHPFLSLFGQEES